MKAYEEFCKDLDQLGHAVLRERLETNVFIGGESNMARAWLARIGETSNAEQLALTRRASADAHKANKIAAAALIIAAASMIITIVGVVVSIVALRSAP